jgi:hypothetical protein
MQAVPCKYCGLETLLYASDIPTCINCDDAQMRQWAENAAKRITHLLDIEIVARGWGHDIGSATQLRPSQLSQCSPD